MITIKGATESDLWLIVLALRMAAGRFESSVRVCDSVGQPRLAQQFTFQHAQALNLARDIEDQS